MEKNKKDFNLIDIIKTIFIFILYTLIPYIISEIIIELLSVNNNYAFLISAACYLIFSLLFYFIIKTFNNDKLQAASTGSIIFIVFMQGASFLGELLLKLIPNETIGQQYLLLSLIYLILLAVFFIIFKNILKNDWTDFKKNRKQYFKKALKYWGKGILIMMISNYIINVYINTGNLSTNETLNREALGTTPFITVFAMVIFAPFVEELVFRAGFKKAFNNAVSFAIFSGLLFGGSHLLSAYQNINDLFSNWKELLYIIPYGVLGFYFAKAYYETNNIYSSISVHMLHNSITVALLLLVSLAGGLS